MKKRKFSGLYIIVAAFIALTVIYSNRGQDKYSVQYAHSDFRQVYLEDYSGDSAALQYYYPKSEDTVKCFTKGPISLEASEDGITYNVEIQYAANDDTTVLKIFAADYISPDNSGGKVFVKENLDPMQPEFKTSFVLNQDVDSLFIVLETKDEDLQIGRLNVTTDNYVYNDMYMLYVAVIACMLAVLYVLNSHNGKTKGFNFQGEYIDSRKTRMLFVLVMMTAVFIASLPILDDGIILGHDTRFHMARIEGIARGLQSGQFPVRIHGGTLNDYGYPNSIFYPELMLYIPAALHILGVSVYSCFKFYVIFMNALTFLIGYVAFKKMSNRRYIGITLSIIYLLLPYRILCAYWRSAIGEFTAMTFLPFVIYGLYAIIYGNKKDWYYLTIGATGVLQSHILTTEMTAVFAVVFVLIGIKELFTKEKRILSLVIAAIFTVVLNFWFIVPMILMMLQLKLEVFNRAALTSRFASFDISNIFAINKIEIAGPYSLGVIVLFTLGLYLVYRTAYMDKVEKLFKAGDNLLVNSIVFTWMSTALFPWAAAEKIPVIGSVVSSVQFPTRFLTIVQLTGVALLALFVSMAINSEKVKKIGCFILVLVALYTNLNFIEYTIIGDGAEAIMSKSCYENNIDNLHSVGQAEYLIAGNNIDYMIAHPPVLESENSTMEIDNFKHWGTKLSFDYKMDITNESDVIVLPITYIPNYIIEVDGQRVYPTKTLDARVAFSVPYEKGSVNVHYAEPLTFRLCEAVSVVSLAAFVFVCSDKGKKFFDKIIKQ